MTPQRIQRKRTKGWKMPQNTVCVTRGTRWGNPFKVEVFGRELAIRLFRNTLRGIWNPSILKHLDDALCGEAYRLYHGFMERIGNHPLEHVAELRGKNLACWCPLEDGDGNRVPCHADVLLELANAGEDE
ncbi:DUF4326 domain-containing protein [Zavarzinella formosa]|uniref:DUF4326 domain-containing protein n=1 Tax=Zavarzinella formosa TaxID=360055 RepID=UPI000366203C|nr:DUF4326 domain-containing protein [Zavarzinella formosa]